MSKLRRPIQEYNCCLALTSVLHKPTQPWTLCFSFVQCGIQMDVFAESGILFTNAFTLKKYINFPTYSQYKPLKNAFEYCIYLIHVLKVEMMNIPARFKLHFNLFHFLVLFVLWIRVLTLLSEWLFFSAEIFSMFLMKRASFCFTSFICALQQNSKGGLHLSN